MLEFGVSQLEMDEVRAEWSFMVGNAECDFVERRSSKFTMAETIGSAKQDVGVDF